MPGLNSETISLETDGIVVRVSPFYAQDFYSERHPNDDGMLTPEELVKLGQDFCTGDGESYHPVIERVAAELAMKGVMYQASGDEILIKTENIDNEIHKVAVNSAYWAVQLKERYIPEALEGKWPQGNGFWPPLVFQRAYEAVIAREQTKSKSALLSLLGIDNPLDS
jgi:hypothetical protein